MPVSARERQIAMWGRTALFHAFDAHALVAALHVHQPAAEDHGLDRDLGIVDVRTRVCAGLGLPPDLAIVEGERGVAGPAVEMSDQMRAELVARLIVRIEHRLAACGNHLGLLVRAQPVVEELQFLRRELVEARGLEIGRRHAFLERGKLLGHDRQGSDRQGQGGQQHQSGAHGRR
jgi:hypothetical protein